jgi:hypothetical protein
MRKALVAVFASIAALFAVFSLPAHAQFNPSNGFQTISNQCGTYFLQGSTYYNGQGVSIGSTLPFCAGSLSTQNAASASLIHAKYTNATLPACNSSSTGLYATETDGAATPVYNATATGGGSTVVSVMCNGTNWTNH